MNWQENSSYGQSMASSVEYDENQGYFTWTGNDDNDGLENWSGQYDGKGLPSVLTAGLHYNDKWDDDRQSVNGNYKILQLNVTGNSQTNSQNILPDTTYYNNSNETFNNQILRNRLNGIYEIQFDSTSSIKMTADAGSDHKITNSHYYTEALAIDSALINQSNRTVSTDGMINTLNSNIIWRKKMAKKGRTISINVREAYKDNQTTGYLFAENDFYYGGFSPKQVVDQYKTFDNKNLLVDSRITYSEPLSTVSSLVANYGISIDNSNSNRNSYSKSPDGKYTNKDSIFSNDYLFNVFTQRTGLNYNLFKKKFRFNVGTDIGFTNFKQDNVVSDSVTRRNFVNWYPSMSMSYNFTQQSRINFRYHGTTVQPTIQQIQPIANNEDPLNIAIGNPNLKPQFTNNFSIFFNDFKVLSERYIYGSIDYNFTEDAITSRDFIDSVGRRVYQSINVNGNYSFNFWFGYGLKWKKIGLDININPSVNTTRFENIVNDVHNVTNSGNYTLGLYLGKSKEKKYSSGLSGSVTYTQSTSSLQSNIKTSYFTYNIRPYADLYLPLKFEIHSDCDFNIRQKTTVFDTNTNVALWNAWVGKKFLKNDALLIKATVNDILNMNIGFNRTVTSNYVSQNTYSTIQRYFMLSVVWNFTKAGTPMPKTD